MKRKENDDDKFTTLHLFLDICCRVNFISFEFGFSNERD